MIKQNTQTIFSKGLTLVELIVSMGLLSILLVLLTGIFASSLDIQLRSEATTSRQQDAQFILTRLAYDFNQATAMTNPSSINQQTSAITLTISGQSWTYSLQNGNLMLTNPQGTFQLNNYLTTVTQFDVTRVGNVGGKQSVQLNLTVGSRIQGSPGNSSVNYSTTLGIR